MLELNLDNQTRVGPLNSLIWANYRPKYVSGFNGPLNPIINITLYLCLGCETNFRGKRISMYPRAETKRRRIVLGAYTLWSRLVNLLLPGGFMDQFHSS